MQKMTVIQPRPRAWLEGSILQPYVSQYGEHLQPARLHVLHRALRPLADPGGYGLEAIGQVAVIRFLSEHLPACVCPDPVRRIRHDLQAALGHLLEVLKAGGVVPQYPARNSAIEQELTRFDIHMRDVWGLADRTRRRRCKVVEEFLVEHVGGQPISMATVKQRTSVASSSASTGKAPQPSPRSASPLPAISAFAVYPAIGLASEKWRGFHELKGNLYDEASALYERI